MVPGRWYHVAGTFDGTLARIFVDGVLEGVIDVLAFEAGACAEARRVLSVIVFWPHLIDDWPYRPPLCARPAAGEGVEPLGASRAVTARKRTKKSCCPHGGALAHRRGRLPTEQHGGGIEAPGRVPPRGACCMSSAHDVWPAAVVAEVFFGAFNVQLARINAANKAKASTLSTLRKEESRRKRFGFVHEPGADPLRAALSSADSAGAAAAAMSGAGKHGGPLLQPSRAFGSCDDSSSSSSSSSDSDGSSTASGGAASDSDTATADASAEEGPDVSAALRKRIKKLKRKQQLSRKLGHRRAVKAAKRQMALTFSAEIRAEVRKAFVVSRENLITNHKLRVNAARVDYTRTVHIGMSPSAANRAQWVGLLAHAAVYGVPLSRQVVAQHWRTGTQSSVAEADRLLDQALTFFKAAVVAQPDDHLYMSAYAYHVCTAVRDPDLLTDVTSDEFQLYW